MFTSVVEVYEKPKLYVHLWWSRKAARCSGIRKSRRGGWARDRRPTVRARCHLQGTRLWCLRRTRVRGRPHARVRRARQYLLLGEVRGSGRACALRCWAAWGDLRLGLRPLRGVGAHGILARGALRLLWLGDRRAVVGGRGGLVALSGGKNVLGGVAFARSVHI